MGKRNFREGNELRPIRKKDVYKRQLAILSGTICDGAKASCAAKIASSVDAGIMGYYMYKNKQQFYAGDGIVAHSVDETIQNIGTLGSQGMLQTNDKIIEMMISCD